MPILVIRSIIILQMNLQIIWMILCPIIIQKTTYIEDAQTTNEYGKIILYLCISSQLRILNGRTLGDTRGKATIHGFNFSSIDDYCICSATLIDDLYIVLVHDFDVTHSDHALILVNIQSCVCHHDTDNLREAPKSIIWDKVKMESFKHNLSFVCKMHCPRS